LEDIACNAFAFLSHPVPDVIGNDLRSTIYCTIRNPRLLARWWCVVRCIAKDA